MSDIWRGITPEEKNLILSRPAEALLAYSSVKLANEKTILIFNHNKIGDRSDAFRHAFWNASMSKLTSISFAEKYATAHEAQRADVLGMPSKNSNGEWDGYTLRDHRNMDLYNNKVGRSVPMNMSIEEMSAFLRTYVNRGKNEKLKWFYEY